MIRDRIFGPVAGVLLFVGDMSVPQKKLTIAVLGLSLLVPAANFAQNTGGCKATAKPSTGKKSSKVLERAHKGGKVQKGHAKDGKIEGAAAGTDKTTSKEKTTSKQ